MSVNSRPSVSRKSPPKKKFIQPPPPVWEDELLELPEPQRSQLHQLIDRSVDEQVFWKIAELRDKTWQNLYRKRKENIIQICDTVATQAIRRKSSPSNADMFSQKDRMS